MEKASDIMVGHFVLLEQNRINKLSPRFEDEPYEEIGKDGSQITIEWEILTFEHVANIRSAHSYLSRTYIYTASHIYIFI